MIVGNYNIPDNIFNRYIAYIKVMSAMRYVDIRAYKIAENERANLHDAILNAIGINRKSNEFASFNYQLAVLVEELLYQEAA